MLGYMFGHVITAMVTPFSDDGTVNYDEAARLALHLINHGSDTLILCGTTGECPTLTHDEELKLFSHIVTTVNGNAKVLAGTGSNCTRTAIEMTKKAAAIGIDGTLQVAPYYNKPSQDGIKRHIEAIATASPLPIMLYNIPSRTGVTMQPNTIASLSEIDTVVSLKEAGGNISQFKAIKQAVPDHFDLYSGDDALTIDFLKEGAVGVVSVASHLVGPKIQEMILAFNSGDIQTAETISEQLNPLFDILFITSNPSPIKYALTRHGFNVGIPRLPLLEPTENEKKQIDALLLNESIMSCISCSILKPN
jgi:4-hydroxy-tetrahydrodipicolinate synthase